MQSRKVTTNIKKAFSGAEYVHSGWMNYLGLQALRAIVSSGYAFARQIKHTNPDELSVYANKLKQDGLIVIEDYLSKAHFTAVANEYNTTVQNAAIANSIDFNETQGFEVGLSRHLDTLPAINKFIKSKRLRELFELGERRKVNIKSGCLEYYEHNKNKGNDGIDTTTRIHSDIFFATHKGWLLIDNVSDNHGPFLYAKGSQKLTLKRLLFDYHSGIISYKEHYPNFYYNDNILSKLQKLELTPITAPKNSLIIANTCGFHKRGQAKPGYVRKAIRLSMRYNPFTFDDVWWE